MSMTASGRSWASSPSMRSPPRSSPWSIIALRDPVEDGAAGRVQPWDANSGSPLSVRPTVWGERDTLVLVVGEHSPPRPSRAGRSSPAVSRHRGCGSLPLHRLASRRLGAHSEPCCCCCCVQPGRRVGHLQSPKHLQAPSTGDKCASERDVLIAAQMGRTTGAGICSQRARRCLRGWASGQSAGRCRCSAGRPPPYSAGGGRVGVVAVKPKAYPVMQVVRGEHDGVGGDRTITAAIPVAPPQMGTICRISVAVMLQGVHSFRPPQTSAQPRGTTLQGCPPRSTAARRWGCHRRM